MKTWKHWLYNATKGWADSSILPTPYFKTCKKQVRTR